MRTQQALVEIGRERLSDECRGCLPDASDREEFVQVDFAGRRRVSRRSR